MGWRAGFSAVAPSLAQFTVLEPTQKGAAQTGAAPSVCGTRPLTIARMTWPSAALLAEIHARLLAAEFGCRVQLVPGDLAASAATMASSGQPAVAPEMWTTRIAQLWNNAVETQKLRSAAPSFSHSTFEGWFVPAYLAPHFSGAPGAANLAAAIEKMAAENPEEERIKFISCPRDWACSLINRNLLRAHGLADRLDIVEPESRLDMDRAIAEAVNRRQPLVFYYWQPNAVLAQLDLVALDMGDYAQEAATCLAQQTCPDPEPSAFAQEEVVIAVSEWVFTEAPTIARYFQRATLALPEMNRLLARVNAPGASIETVADNFIAQRADIWQAWTAPTP